MKHKKWKLTTYNWEFTLKPHKAPNSHNLFSELWHNRWPVPHLVILDRSCAPIVLLLLLLFYCWLFIACVRARILTSNDKNTLFFFDFFIALDVFFNPYCTILAWNFCLGLKILPQLLFFASLLRDEFCVIFDSRRKALWFYRSLFFFDDKCQQLQQLNKMNKTKLLKFIPTTATTRKRTKLKWS